MSEHIFLEEWIQKRKRELLEAEKEKKTREEAEEKEKSILEEGKEIKWEERKVLEGRIQVKMPANFVEMGEEQAKKKYPLEQRAKCIFTNEDTSVTFTFSSYDDYEAKKEDIPRARDLLLEVIKRGNPGITILEKREREGEVGPLYEFTLISPAIDVEIYHIFSYFLIKKCMYQVTFACTEWNRWEWEKVAEEMIQSIQEVPRGR